MREFATVATMLVVAASVGCTPERVEYRYRNPLSDAAKDEVDRTLPDGTRIVYRDRPSVASGKFGASEVVAPVDGAGSVTLGDQTSVPELQTRVVHPDGSVELRAFTPGQVIAHLQYAVRDREYAPFYNQMLTKEARTEWDKKGGEPAFAAWLEEQRKPLMEFLNRTSVGMYSSDVVTVATGARSVALRLTPHLHGQFKFTSIEFERQQGGTRLRSLQ